jgi:alpha-tubulin suppressor-like RCC1 family protein
MKVYICGTKKPFQYQHLQVQNIEQRLNIKDIACGANHIILLTEDNQLWVAGDNSYGELGMGTTTAESEFRRVDWDQKTKIRQITCGMHSTALITQEKNELFVCGNNEHGMLGIGNEQLYVSKFTRVQLPDGCRGVKQISMGGDHCIILGGDNNLYASGNNMNGQLGLGNTKDQYTFQRIPINLNIQQISCGYRHSLLLTKENELYVCGQNKCGQLGLGDTNQENCLLFTKCHLLSQIIQKEKVKQIFAGWYHSEILTENGILFSCGSNSHGELGDLYLPEKNFSTFRQINLLSYNVLFEKLCMTCPTGSTFILGKDRRSCFVSGFNHYYQLCLGDDVHRTDLTKVPLHFEEKEEQIYRIAHGSRVTALVTSNTKRSFA